MKSSLSRDRYRTAVRGMALALTSGLLLFCSISGAEEQKPNIVLVLLDNFGYGEVGAYGGGVLRGAPTPRIDSLARDGLKLTNFNVELLCTSSRSALITGRFAVRSGTHNLSSSVDGGLVQWEVTLAEMLHDAGYVSAHFGKWHLGNRPGRYPTDQGFDEWYGIPRSSDEALWTTLPSYDSKLAPPSHTLEGRKGGETRELGVYDIEMRSKIDAEVTRRAIGFIRQQARSKTPFFAYLPLTTGHYPTVPSPEWQGKTGNGPWADVLAQLDDYIGQLLDALDAAGLSENTVFIFTSDNGPEGWEYDNRGWAGPWRGTYWTALEGGLRVPFLIRWPGNIPAGVESNEIMHLVDVFPTLARMAGGKVPSDRAIDGVDQTDFLTGRQRKSNRDFFPVFDSGLEEAESVFSGRLLAAKWRHWKLHYYEKNFSLDYPKQGFYFVNLLTNPLEERGGRRGGIGGVGEGDVWVRVPIGKRVAEFQASLDEYPPIKTNTPDPYIPPTR